MVEECCKFVDQTPDKETKLKLIDTLRMVTEGKVSVSCDRLYHASFVFVDLCRST